MTIEPALNINPRLGCTREWANHRRDVDGRATLNGLVLKTIELPSVETFQKRVEQRAEAVDLSMDDVDQLVHEARSTDE